MAIDWNKEITFAGLGKKRHAAKAVYPEKTYMNLVVRDKVSLDVRRVVLLAAFLVVFVALFAKFGVWDFFDRVNQGRAQLAQEEVALSQLEDDLQNYGAVQEEYESFDSNAVGDGDTVGALDALALVEGSIRSSATIVEATYESNTLSLDLTDITLDSVGELAGALKAQPIVSDVLVSTATNQGKSTTGVTATMVITLQKA